MRPPGVIARYVPSYNDRDVPGMVGCFTPDVVVRNVSGGEVSAEANGRAALAEAGRQAFHTRSQAMTNAITVLDTTVVEIDYSATVASDPPNGWRAGQSMAFTGASAFELREGLIPRVVDVG